VLVVALVATAGLAACNSTNRYHGDTGLRTRDLTVEGSGSGDGGAATDETATTVAAGTGAGAGGSAAAAGRATGGAGSARGSLSGSTPAAPTKGTVKIGFGYPKNLSAAYAAFGANNLTGDDWKVYIEPIVAWVNAHGGLAGRAVTAVYHATDPTSGTFQSQAEAACAAFTQDDKVFAVVGTVLAENEVDCLAKTNTPFLAQSAALFERANYTRHPGIMWQPFMVSAERQGPWIDSLVTQGYFGTGAKIGLLDMDHPMYKRFADGVIKPRLASHGLQVADTVSFTVPDSAAGAGSLFTQASNAVLRFRSEGITHVILSPSGSAIPFAFMQPAESQGFRPRYGLNSLDVPAFLTQNVQLAQLHGALGVGWLPASDLFYKEVAHGVNPAEDLCYAITKRNGDEVKRYCDGLFFLKAALDRAPEFSAAGLRVGADSLGTGYDSPWTLATRFAPGRFDGARQARPLAFVDDCGCFRYTGGPVEVP